MGKGNGKKTDLHPDVKRALKVVIDVDSSGESEGCTTRHAKIRDVLTQIKQENLDCFQTASVYSFFVEERDWSVPFTLIAEQSGCVLKLSTRTDFMDTGHHNIKFSSTYASVYAILEPNAIRVDLPMISKMTVEDLLHGVELFLIADVMDG